MSLVRILHSATAGHVPSSLVTGQLAINEADRKLFFRGPSGAVESMDLSGNGNRNLVINAAMLSRRERSDAAVTINQNSGKYLAELFYLYNECNQPCSASIVDGPLVGTKAIRASFTNAPTSGDLGIYTYWDEMSLQAGRSSHLTNYVRSTNTFDYFNWFGQEFGGGGSNPVLTTLLSGTHTGNANWIRYVGSGTIPSIAGKVIGTDAYVHIAFGFTPRNAGIFDFGCFQFGDGPAHDFMVQTLSLEMPKINRWWQTSYPPTGKPGDASSGAPIYAQGIDATVEFGGGPMRKVPGLTLYAYNTGTSGKVTVASGDHTLDGVSTDQNKFYFWDSNSWCQFHYVADARK